jgi:hypothetical protein
MTGLEKLVLLEDVIQGNVVANKTVQSSKKGVKAIIASPALQGPPWFPNCKIP